MAALPDRVSARAGIVVTGTEVLTGRVTDRNGPWLSERLRELGVDHAYTLVVGDRREDMEEALRFMAARGVDVIVTSGGLGPTADDLTAEVVGAFAGREMALDEALEERIAEILRPLLSRWPDLDPDAIRASNRKQAVVPVGATVLEPVGTAPGLVVPVDGGPTVVVLPGPPRELHAMWPAAVETSAFRAAVAGAVELRQEMLRLFGIPESEIAETLRLAEDAHGLSGLEITTCLRRGEVEVVTRFSPDAAATYARFVETVRERHADTLFSDDGRTVDQQVADMLRARGADDRHGRVLHRRPARRAADRARRLLGLRAGRARRLLQRGQGLAGRGRSRADRAAWAPCRSRWPRRWPTARGRGSAPTTGSASPAWPGPGEGRPTSRWASCASAWQGRTGRGSRAR